MTNYFDIKKRKMVSRIHANETPEPAYINPIFLDSEIPFPNEFEDLETNTGDNRHPEIRLAESLSLDPFCTSRTMDAELDGEVTHAIRFGRAAAAYADYCTELGDFADPDRRNILYRIALYWLQKSNECDVWGGY